MKTHALLSASGSERWIACPGSIAAARGAPRSSSTYAEEGEAAHAVAEDAVRFGTDPSERVGERVRVESGNEIEITEEMAEGAKCYAAILTSAAPAVALQDCRAHLILERSLADLLAVYHPDLGGTLDAGVIDYQRRRVRVFDYKFGRGIVVPADTSQLRIYALGLCRLGIASGPSGWCPDMVDLTICQPRAADDTGRVVRSVSIKYADLLAWAGAVLIPAALATGRPDAPRVAGEHCRFCAAAGSCSAREAERVGDACEAFGVTRPADLAPIVPPPAGTLSVEQALRVLRFFAALDDYPAQVLAALQARAEGGEEIPGYKLVAKRANRRWVEGAEAALVERCADVLGSDGIYSPREILSPAKLETKLKAARVKPDAVLAGLVDRPDTGVILVPVSDRRPEIQASAAKGRAFVDHLQFMG